MTTANLWADCPPEQREPEWLDKPENRKGRFGTSHTAVLFDEHPFQTAADYWLDKLHGTSPDETPAMKRGTFLEPSIIAWLEDELNWKIDKVLPTYRSHLISLPDGKLHGSETLVSIKTTARRTDVPEAYWVWQAQAEMLVTGEQHVIICWLDGSMELQWITIDRDESVYDAIWQRSKEFMDTVMAEGDMPEWIHRTADDVIRQHPDPLAEAFEGGLPAWYLIQDYWQAKVEADRYSKAASALRDEIFAMMGEYDTLTDDTGNVIATTKGRAGSKRFDTKRFQAENPVLHEQYVVQGAPTRTLNIPKAIKTTIEGGPQ